ncbi:predicted protein [Fibroporia radiculosa]|uniref:Uncharacterized protein n=1 Tax=Fibroporia radiculosa TaxID=599839 RepID=J7SC81_9APHY|nr:predicted protein [Fibroporia radiculosa]
MHLQTERS